MWYVIAGVLGALVAAGLIYAYQKLRSQPGALAGYTPEQAEKERERIQAHADQFRDRIKAETEKGHSEVDDF